VPFLRGPQARLGDPQRLGDSALLFERLVALAAQLGDELRRIAGLLVEHRDLPTYAAMTYAAWAVIRPCSALGRRTMNSLYSPSLLSTDIVPPCCCVTMS
jgi:hypothetical protein